jgi:hypothetical protein
MSNVVLGKFPGDGKGSGGSGPEDPMLENRVARLEEQSERIERILQDMAPRIVELHSRIATRDDLNRVEASLKADNARLDSRASHIEGRLDGIEKRFDQIPTVWGLLGILATLIIGITGLMVAYGQFIKS